MNKKALRKGFTLIELLIVIVIIGVLATTVLSAINPIEQIKKAQDAGKRSDSAEILNALERYYTAFQAYPWNRTGTTVTNTPPYPGSAGVAMANASGVVIDWVTDTTYGLVAVDELKDEFTARSSLSDIYAFWSGGTSGTDLVRVCFAPQSKTNQNQSKWSSSGEATCTPSATVTCYQCVPE